MNSSTNTVELTGDEWTLSLAMEADKANGACSGQSGARIKRRQCGAALTRRSLVG